MIEVDGLTVRYGGVTSLDAMSLTFEQGTCGLIGPNGAGKTTFFNVLSGFVRPAAGTVRAFGADLLSMAHYRRARWGVRRTFQTEQAIEELSIYDNVAMVDEHFYVSPDWFWENQERYDTYSGRVVARFRGSMAEWQSMGVLNFEMESAALFTMCTSQGLRAGCVAGVLVNRTQQETPDEETARRIESTSVAVVVDAARRLVAIPT